MILRKESKGLLNGAGKTIYSKMSSNIKLITGGLGFVGINLARKLAKNGYKVRIFDKKKQEESLGKNIEYFHGDITNFDSVYDACKDVDCIFNLASLLPCSRAGNMFIKVNVGGTKNVLESAKKRGIRKIVHVSSSIVYGIPEKILASEKEQPKPIGDYGRSKLAAERLCIDYTKKGIRITILRPRMIIGAGRLGLLTILFDWIKRGKRIYLIGSGKNRFQMVSVWDLIDACILAMDKGSNQIFNIGADNTPQLVDLMNNLIKHANSKSKVFPLNATMTRNALKLLDKMKLTPLNVEHYLIADKDYVLDISKAEKLLGWKPKHHAYDFMNEAYDFYINNIGKISDESKSDFPRQKLLKLIRFFS